MQYACMHVRMKNQHKRYRATKAGGLYLRKERYTLKKATKKNEDFCFYFAAETVDNTSVLLSNHDEAAADLGR